MSCVGLVTLLSYLCPSSSWGLSSSSHPVGSLLLIAFAPSTHCWLLARPAPAVQYVAVPSLELAFLICTDVKLIV